MAWGQAVLHPEQGLRTQHFSSECELPFSQFLCLPRAEDTSPPKLKLPLICLFWSKSALTAPAKPMPSARQDHPWLYKAPKSIPAPAHRGAVGVNWQEKHDGSHSIPALQAQLSSPDTCQATPAPSSGLLCR